MGERAKRAQQVDVAGGIFAGAGMMWLFIATGWLSPSSYVLGAGTVLAWRIWQLARSDRRTPHTPKENE